MSIWDDPDLKSNDNYVKFENPGDSVTGTITAIRKHTFDDGNTVPMLLIQPDEGDEVTLTASQMMLKKRLAELRPTEGDRIGIRFDSVEQRSGGKTLKHFTVEVKNGDAPAPAPAPAAAPQPAADSLI